VHKWLINKYFDLRSLDNTCACLELMQIRGGIVDIYRHCKARLDLACISMVWFIGLSVYYDILFVLVSFPCFLLFLSLYFRL